ncbi:hypothetical protein BDZ91DRAFT_741951 [Kalaharituber pfeilii]|nr:hypothetical protein BDZ91DRAFT_741951 [Kalaharituber pfeilii]
MSSIFLSNKTQNSKRQNPPSTNRLVKSTTSLEPTKNCRYFDNRQLLVVWTQFAKVSLVIKSRSSRLRSPFASRISSCRMSAPKKPVRPKSTTEHVHTKHKRHNGRNYMICDPAPPLPVIELAFDVQVPAPYTCKRFLVELPYPLSSPLTEPGSSALWMLLAAGGVSRNLLISRHQASQPWILKVAALGVVEVEAWLYMLEVGEEWEDAEGPVWYLQSLDRHGWGAFVGALWELWAAKGCLSGEKGVVGIMAR